MSVVADPTKPKRPNPRPRQHGGSAAHGPGLSRLPAVWGPRGWLTSATEYPAPAEQDPLVCHGDWRGPAKLIHVGGRLHRLTEVFVSHELFGDQSFDGESSEQLDSLFADLNASLFADRSRVPQLPWRAPEAEQLVKWLSDGGFQPAVDDEGSLRLTLKARGCDGQVHVSREDQRLRLTMRLGSWSGLDRETEKAMLDLARQANDRARLARIAWIVYGNTRRCEAQIDFTGLSTDGPAERIWPDMLCMSIRGLELALRWLGMELDVLADPCNRAITTQLISGTKPESVGTVPAADS